MEEKIETKEVEINWKGNKEKVELKELSFGERNQCLRESTEIDVMTGKGRIDPVTFNEKRLLRSIIKASFEVTLNNINSLRSRDGDKLFKALDEFGTLTEEEGKKNQNSNLEREISAGTEIKGVND